MIGTNTLFFALLGGVLPTLLWLWFWLREDARPEPRRLIMLAFFAGMLAVAVALPVEEFLARSIGGSSLLIIWAGIEEIAKFAIVYVLVLRRREMDEPIDAIIYMITAALGFAAIENSLFLINPIGHGQIIDSLITGNMRFFGATLLHTLSSSVVGISMAFLFYRKKLLRREALAVGVILAIALHALFNFLILGSNGKEIFFTFFGVWIGVIGLIFVFERVKKVRRSRFVYLGK